MTIKDFAVMKILTFRLRICSIKRTSLGREAVLSLQICIFVVWKKYLLDFLNADDNWGGGAALREGDLRAHTTHSPWVCANTDEKRGKSMTLRWQIPLYLHLQWLSGQEKKVWMCWARWLWLLKIAFIKVMLAAQTFNYHGEGFHACSSPLVLPGSNTTTVVRCSPCDGETGWTFPEVLSS